MRKITVLEHITPDGVIQAGGGPDEDTSDGFAYGLPFKVTESIVGSSGVILANYERAGAVQTGTIGQ